MSPLGWCNSTHRLEHNVKFVFLFTLVFWAASSLLSQQVLAGYIYVLTASNRPVGIVKSVQGLAQLLCALPAGFAADFVRRDRILACAGAIGIATAILTGLAFQLGSLPLIYTSFGLWGVFSAFQSPAMEALFADSVPLGQRSLPFTLKHMVLHAALVLGPVVAIVLFWHYGDTWTLDVLRPVLLVGSFVAALSMATLFQFNDDLAFENQQHVLAVERELNSIGRHFSAEMTAYGELDDADDRESEASNKENDAVDDVNDNRVHALAFGFSPVASTRPPSEFSMLLRSSSAGSNHNRTGVASRTHSPVAMYMTNPSAGDWLYLMNNDDANDRLPPLQRPTCCGLDATSVPLLLVVSDVVISNGNGMAVHFVPLFFLTEFAFPPIQMTTLFALLPLGVALCSFGAQLASRCVGRMPVIITTRLFGAFALLAMAVAPTLELQCALFLLKGAMLRCSEPLRRSLLMDFVPKSQRARWNSFEALTRFSSTGSAVLGGAVIDAHGYRVCFGVAALVCLLGVVIETALVPITKFAVEVDSPDVLIINNRQHIVNCTVEHDDRKVERTDTK